ncbi:MAG: hypothetical protein K8S98_15165 [Planctomycetes bacterium]|nr:hypothetical protein [Planctomycetota bacterium]
MTLTEARAAFAVADADASGVLEGAELAAAAIGPDDVRLADRDADGRLGADEFLSGLPLILARAGRRAAPDLEAEAIRLRILAAPQPARSAGPSANPTDASGIARGRLVSAVRTDPPRAEPARPRATTVTSGPATARLRTAPSSAEAETRLQAAREALNERLQRSGETPTTPPPTPATGAPSQQRRWAQDAERNDSTVTAQRLRAARQTLDERIRGARQNSAATPGGETPPRPRDEAKPEVPAPLPGDSPPRPKPDAAPPKPPRD